MQKQLGIILILAFFLSSCSVYKIDSQNVSDKYYRPKKSTEEIVYLEKLDQAHMVIAVVTVNAERRQRLGDIIEKMKNEASILGGDAITNIKTDASGLWKKLPAQQLVGNAYVRANFTAEVIVFE